MNTAIEISSLPQYIEEIEQITDSDVSYLYRGQENAEWQVTSSAYRRLKKQSDSDLGPLEIQSTPDTSLFNIQTDVETGSLQKPTDAETDIATDLFLAYLKQIIDEIQLRYPSTYRDLTPLECMAHLQHNKVATGLIDFTYSPLVALWFACDNQEKKDGKVFIITNDSNKIEEITTTHRLEQDLDDFIDTDQAQWFLWTPTLDNLAVDTQRMTMQQSVFLFGLPIVDNALITQEIIVPQSQKASLRTALAKLGITERTLFSDILGFYERNTHAHPYDISLAESYYGES